MIRTAAALRKHLGMDEGQLLTNSNGEMADIISVVDGKTVILGIVSTGQQLEVPLENFYKEDPTK